MKMKLIVLATFLVAFLHQSTINIADANGADRLRVRGTTYNAGSDARLQVEAKSGNLQLIVMWRGMEADGWRPDEDDSPTQITLSPGIAQTDVQCYTSPFRHCWIQLVGTVSGPGWRPVARLTMETNANFEDTYNNALDLWGTAAGEATDIDVDVIAR